MTLTTYNTTFGTKLTDGDGSSLERINATFEYDQDFTGDGYNDIKVTLELHPDDNSGTEDMIGIAFDINNDAVSNLAIQNIQRFTENGDLSNFTPSIYITTNGVPSSGQDAIPGFPVTVPIDGNFDVGIQFSDGGDGDGIVQKASFILTKLNTSIEKSLIEYTDWYIRLQSTDGGQKSAKMGGVIGEISGANPEPSIDVEKYVSVDGDINWLDADTVTGPTLLESGAANLQFKFEVSNTGNVDLSNVTLSDSDFDLDGLTGDATTGNNQYNIATLAAGASTEVILTGTPWQADQHTNTATANGSYNTITVSDTDDANYFGANPAITIDKVTTATTASGVQTGDNLQNVLLGSNITWTYTVTNTGNVSFEESNIIVTDDQGVYPTRVNYDDNTLDPNETWEYTATGSAIPGDYSNIGTVTVKDGYTDSVGNTTPVSGTDSSSYSSEKGLGKTPGFWKQEQHFPYWPVPYTPYIPRTSFSETFLGADQSGDKFTYGGVQWFNDSLLEALSTDKDSAGSKAVNTYGNVSALGRSATAALLNAKSDELIAGGMMTDVKGSDINYIIDEDALLKTIKLGDDFKAIVETLKKVDLDSNWSITPSEVIYAVKDVFTLGGGLNGKSDVNALATAFDKMNNMGGG